jgi:hypothetical protein
MLGFFSLFEERPAQYSGAGLSFVLKVLSKLADEAM